MARILATTLKNRPAIASSEAGEVVADTHTATAPVTLAAGDIIVLGKLGAGQKIVDCILASADLDVGATPLIVVSVGVIDAVGTGLEAGQTLIASSTVAQAGGVARLDTPEGLLIAADDTVREVGAKIVTVAATKAAGDLTLTLMSSAK